MPCWWPSFQVNRMPYFPTGSTSVGRAKALKIGSVPATGLSGSPGWRLSFPRSSSHSAQGQASRRKTKLYELRWPSFHSTSMPEPVLLLTLTDFGSATCSMTVCPPRGPKPSIAENRRARDALHNAHRARIAKLLLTHKVDSSESHT